MLIVIFYRSRAHIQRCQGDSDLANQLVNTNDDEGCVLELAEIEDSEQSTLEVVRFLFTKLIMVYSNLIKILDESLILSINYHGRTTERQYWRKLF